MEIPQVSISVDTTDSGAPSVETCREVILDKCDDPKHARDDGRHALAVTKHACDHVKNAVDGGGNSDLEKKRSIMCRSMTTGSGNKHNNCSSIMSSSSRGSITYQPYHTVIPIILPACV